jgi:hypothetical protein
MLRSVVNAEGLEGPGEEPVAEHPQTSDCLSHWSLRWQWQ